MTIAIGTDIVSISRVSAALERQGERFARRILTSGELERFMAHASPASWLAKRFAAKEAASKALGTGIGEVSWQDMEVLNDDRGAPSMVFSGRALELMQQLGAHRVLLSLSDEREHALAFVVLD